MPSPSLICQSKIEQAATDSLKRLGDAIAVSEARSNAQGRFRSGYQMLEYARLASEEINQFSVRAAMAISWLVKNSVPHPSGQDGHIARLCADSIQSIAKIAADRTRLHFSGNPNGVAEIDKQLEEHVRNAVTAISLAWDQVLAEMESNQKRRRRETFLKLVVGGVEWLLSKVLFLR